MIKLDKLVTEGTVNNHKWLEEFELRNRAFIQHVSKGSQSVTQDILILAWAWRLGGWTGSEESWIEHLSDRVTSENDVHRVRELKQRQVDKTVFMDRLIDHAARQNNGSVEYLISYAPEEHQQVLTWKYVAGYSDREISEMLGKDRSTISGHVRKSYKHLRDRFVAPIG